MPQKKLGLTDALILFGVGFGVYTIYDRSKKRTGSSAGEESYVPDTPTPGRTTTKPATTASSPSPYPIERGSRGELVKLVQQKLGINADGIFGVQTENALVQRTGATRITGPEGLRRVMNDELRPGPNGPIYTPGGSTSTAPAPTTPTTTTTVPVQTTPSAVPEARYGTFPLKVGSNGQYVRNLQKHLGVSIDGKFGSGTQAALVKKHGTTQVVSLDQLNAWIIGKPTATTTAPKPTTTTTKPATAINWKELDAVFRAVWDPVAGNPGMYRARLIADKTAITNVLSGKSDANLNVFIGQYNRAYAKLKGISSSRKTPTLYADLSSLTIVGGSALALLKARVQRLS